MVNESKKDENLLKPEKVEETVVTPPLKPEPVKEVETPKDTVEIKKDTLESLLNRIERLEKTANKGRIDNYDRMNQEDPETIYKLRTINGKIVISWSDLITNMAEVNPVTKKVEEDQTATYYFEDGTKQNMSISIFNRRYSLINTKLVKEEKLIKAEDKKKYGNHLYTVETHEGKEYQIGELFIN